MVEKINFLTRGRVWMLLAALTLAAAFLRFYRVGEMSVWDGEIFTLLFAQYDWNILLASVSSFSAHPPLWFALTKIAIAGGWNETLLRVPAVLAGIVSVPALYVLGKRLFDTRVGLFGATLFTFSPLAVMTAQNARNYSLFILLTILMLYSVARATATQSPRVNAYYFSLSPFQQIRLTLAHARWWILFAFVAITGLYTHYLFMLPLGGTALAMALKLIHDAMRHADAIRSTGALEKKQAWWGIALVSARPLLVALIAVTALYLPWAPAVGSAFLDRQLTREEANQDEEWTLTFQDVPRTLKDFSGAATWGLVLFATLAAVGVVWAWRAQKYAALFWIGISLALPILVMILLAPRRLPAKYLIFIFPAYLLFVAGGIVGVADFLQARVLRSAPRASVAALGLLALLLLTTLPNMPYWNGRETIFTGKGWKEMDAARPWREIAAYVMERAAPGDFILFPNEARALTARSVTPYFDDAFLKTLYSAPPTGRAWWVSETEDVVARNAPRVRGEQAFENVVVQELGNANEFVQVQLPNASFENGFLNWEKASDAVAWTQDLTNVVDGIASARMTLNRPRYTNIRSGEFAATPGKLYRVTSYVKNPTLGFYTVSPQLFVNFYEPNNKSPKRTRLATLVPTDKPGWVLMVAEGIVPEDTATARVEFGVRDYAYTFGATTWIDDIKVWVEK